MLTDKQVQALREGQFELDCPEITLTAQATQEPLTYQGPGSIFQSPDGQLRFKIYSVRAHDIREVFRHTSVGPGRVIPDHEYYSLSAVDLAGGRWAAQRLSPQIHIGNPARAAVVSGGIHELSKASTRHRGPQHAVLTLDVFHDVEMPVNAVTQSETTVAGRRCLSSGRTNLATFQSCELDFLLTKEDGGLRIEVVSSAPSFPTAHIELRVVEALQFVLAQPIWWSAMQKEEQGDTTVRIRQWRREQSKRRLLPPIKFDHFNHTGHVWRLFDAYFRHILNCQSDRWHPISAQVYSCYEAAGGSIDLEGLTLGVAVEGILSTEFPGVANPSADFLQSIEAFRDYLSAWEGDGNLKEQIRGTISNMNQARAKDKLLRFVRDGVIRRSEYDAWDSLRNSTAHADRAGSMPIQEFLDLCYSVTVLFYNLIFHAIGYNGRYTDYGTPDWPIADFPHAVPISEDER